MKGKDGPSADSRPSRSNFQEQETDFTDINVLEDPAIRQGIKDYKLADDSAPTFG